MPADIQLSGHGGVAGKRYEPGNDSAAISGQCKGAVFPYPHRLPALPGYAHRQRAGRRQPDHNPVQAEYLPAKGLEQLLSTVAKVKRQINPKLQIDGILLTMVDNRTNFAKEIAALLRETYGSKIKVFGTRFPILSGQRKPARRAGAFSPMTQAAK